MSSATFVWTADPSDGMKRDHHFVSAYLSIGGLLDQQVQHSSLYPALR